jgi:DNA-binding CsgD family transcriptional regulator
MTNTRAHQSIWDALSDREKQAAILVAQGYTREDGADEMSIATKTFDHHRLQVLHKLDLEGTVALVWFCLAHNVLDSNAKVL